jgi:hypothetical protein
MAFINKNSLIFFLFFLISCGYLLPFSGSNSYQAAAQSASQQETSPASPIHVVPLGNFTFSSQPQDKNSDILTCTGGIYAYWRDPSQDTLMELRAQNAVVFYSQQKLLQGTTATDAKPDEQSTLNIAGPLGIYLEGDVIFQMDKLDTKITADRLYYDFTDNTALMIDSTMRMNIPDQQEDVPVYIRAQSIRQWSGNHFSGEIVRMSNDEFYLPHVWLGAKKIDIFSEKPLTPQKTESTETNGNTKPRFDMQDVSVNLETMPIFWWPRAAGTIGRTKLPIKALHTGMNSERGFGVESEWDLPWLLGMGHIPGVDSTLHIDEFSKRGPATGIELDYTRDKSYGLFDSYLIHDQGEDRLGRFEPRKDVPVDDQTRGRVSWQHRQYLPYDWQANFVINYLSDENFLESWYEKEFDTEDQQETSIYFKQQRDNWALDFLNEFHLNDFTYTQTQLPTVGLHVAGQNLFDTFTYYHDGYVSRISERADDRLVPDLSGRREPSVLPGMIDETDSAFSVSRHELALPLHVGAFHFMPTGIGTYVYDDSGPENSFVQGAIGLRAATQLWHIDNTAKSQMWDIDRIRHVIIPQASAFWVDSDLKGVVHHDVFNFALNQRFQTMRGPAAEKYSTDLLTLNTSVTLVTKDVDDVPLPGNFFFSQPEDPFGPTPIVNYDLANLGLAKRKPINQNLSDHADADWLWNISETTSVSGALNYNIRDGLISAAESAIAVQRSPRTRYYVGYRFLQNGNIDIYNNPAYDRNNPNLATKYLLEPDDGNFLTSGIAYQFNKKYTVAVSQQYDITETAAAYTRTTIIRKFPHWFGAFSVGYDATSSGISFTLSFWPEGYDKVAIGSRRFSRIAP